MSREALNKLTGRIYKDFVAKNGRLPKKEETMKIQDKAIMAAKHIDRKIKAR